MLGQWEFIYCLGGSFVAQMAGAFVKERGRGSQCARSTAILVLDAFIGTCAVLCKHQNLHFRESSYGVFIIFIFKCVALLIGLF